MIKILPGILPLFFAAPAWAGTCALCRQALSIAGGPGLITGFYWSIILIAGMPLLIIACVAVAHIRGMKQHDEKDSSLE